MSFDGAADGRVEIDLEPEAKGFLGQAHAGYELGPFRFQSAISQGVPCQ